ncbi:hypothetical protein [Streptomyces rochei]|uniref:hypothetical protein n=1 Tax=Streptomyces rochei TaxID=1928 RepID=UPI0022E9F776|nr:hypothetical protein [Streptomyces rochei]MCC8452773.1 hypothetical protein [Streptomyces rochei]
MNFLPQQTIMNGNHLPAGPHFVHCYIYEGLHCSCGGSYQSPNPGSELDVAAVVEAADRATEK